MEYESKQEVLERRRELEQEITAMLEEVGSEFSLQDVTDAIYNETEEDDMTGIIAMFDRGGDASELSNILELVTDAWNYFPHELLNGRSPAEILSQNRRSEEDVIHISFTRKQYWDLLRTVYLGQWMANAIHDRSKEDPIDEDIDKIEHYIHSFAKDFGFEKFIEYDKERKEYFPTNELDELMQTYIDEYEEHFFWEEFFHRMSNRDFARAYSKKEIETMELKELFEKEEPFRNKWEDEINNHELNRLEFKE